MQAPVGSVEPRRTGGDASSKAARPHTPDPGSTRGQRLGKGAHCVRVRGRSAARENGRSPYTTGPTRRSSSAHQPVSQVITRSPMHASRLRRAKLILELITYWRPLPWSTAACRAPRWPPRASAPAGTAGAGERRTPEGSYVPSNRCTQTHGPGTGTSAFNTLARRRAGHASYGS